MKTRYFIFISYKGTLYHGWQIQPGSRTIQQTLEDCLSLILGEKTELTGAGRTDTGVHASYFCAHFDCKADDLDTRKNLIFRINKFIPWDISIISIKKALPEAHARFGALSRTYKYYISRKKDPFSTETTWCLYGDLDIVKMNEACAILSNYKDFTSFSRLHTDVKTNNCKIYNANWEQEGERLIFTIKADRFLRNMVRAIVGTMVDIGQGKLTLEDFENIIIAKDRGKAGQSAPAKGLFLTDIEYPSGIFYGS
ncbi:MAG TPA: tRNA pseudouridine(38-40) synthase TruA [Bacteroidales bacterium]|nr:tRNA pseudouridine(38-40) synthase TruA [Bacteroidales bacterium]